MKQIQLSQADIERITDCIQFVIDNANQDEFDNIILNQFETIDPQELETLKEGLMEQAGDEYDLINIHMETVKTEPTKPKYIYFEDDDPTEVIDWANENSKEGYKLMGGIEPILFLGEVGNPNIFVYHATMELI